MADSGNGKGKNIIPKVTAPKSAPIVKLGQTQGSDYGQHPPRKKKG